jgi:uncharacterized protein YdiU (UPF0061 family)
LVPLMPDTEAAIEDFTAMLHEMQAELRRNWTQVFCAKIGIAAPQEGDDALVSELLAVMEAGHADFTNTFRGLVRGSARDEFTNPDAYEAWHGKWQARIASETGAQDLMEARNPVLIPRNHRIEQMIAAAVQGDFAPFERLGLAYAAPFAESSEFADLQRPPLTDEIVPATFCGT